jgi:PAS domain S-box-containing protein
MRLNAKILVPWVLFSLLLAGGFLLFELQLRTLQTELTEHVAIHGQAVKIARALQFLSQERLTTALLPESGPLEQTVLSLSTSEDQTERLIADLKHLLSQQVHTPTVEGGDQGHSILASYMLARRSLPDLYRTWLQTRAAGNLDQERFRRVQLLQHFEVAKAALEDLSQYLEITQAMVIAQTSARVAHTQVFFYSFVTLLLLAVLGFSLYQGYTVALPLRKLSGTARTIASGGNAHFDLHTAVDEIDSLSDSLSRMLTTLRQSHADLARQEQKYRVVSDYSSDWEYWLGPDGRFLYVSPACQAVAGLGAQTFYDRPATMLELVHPADRARWVQCQDRTRASDQVETTEVRLVRPDGQQVWIENQCRGVFDERGQSIGLRGVNREISERKQLEQDRARYQQRLEADVAARTAELSRKSAELELAVKDLEGFSYSVSHDLRAPLRAIDGFIAMLLEEHAGQLDEEGRRMFGVVQDNARKMGHLIDDILAFSRAGRLEIDIQTVDMNLLLQEVWADLAEARQGRDLRLEAAELPPVPGDPRALRQIWSNLLSNAIKFSGHRQPGLVRVAAEPLEDSVRFLVCDNGVGFKPEYADKLFVLFQRLHGMDEFEGTGVGLAIVKRFVQKHGGTVSATAVPEVGATFSFTLPLQAHAQVAGSGLPPAPAP